MVNYKNMKFQRFYFIFSSLLLLTGLILAQTNGVTGEWIAKGENRTISLKVEVIQGAISATLDGMGETFTLKGNLTALQSEGTATSVNGEAYYKFIVKEDTLTLTLANYDQTGKPDMSTAVTVILERDFGPKAQAGFNVPGFAPPPEDPLIATWRNTNINLTLKNAGKNKYTGTIELNKQKANITATGNAKSLKGTFKLGKVTKYFSAKLENDRLKLILDGKTQTLGRVR